MDELKPCPFCGGEGHLLEHSFRGCESTYGVVCADCYCQTRQFYEKKQEAVYVWNRRVEENRPPAVEDDLIHHVGYEPWQLGREQ